MRAADQHRRLLSHRTSVLYPQRSSRLFGAVLNWFSVSAMTLEKGGLLRGRIMAQAGERCLTPAVGPIAEDSDPRAQNVGSQRLAKPLEALRPKRRKVIGHALNLGSSSSHGVGCAVVLPQNRAGIAGGVADRKSELAHPFVDEFAGLELILDAQYPRDDPDS
jgi:hypothetical protein